MEIIKQNLRFYILKRGKREFEKTAGRLFVETKHKRVELLQRVNKTSSASCRLYHSGPKVHLPEFSTLTEFLFQRSSTYAQRTALIDGESGESETYEELEQHIDHVTQQLHRLGLRHSDVITIFGSNNTKFVHVLCACASLGVIVSLANSQLPTNELVSQLQLSGTKLVFTTAECSQTAVEASRLLELREPVVFGEAPQCLPFSTLSAAPPRRTTVKQARDPEETLLLPFSSGTTGLPKAVCLSHRNLCSQLMALRHTSYLPMTSDNATSICTLPMVHIAGLVIGALNALSQGASVVVLPRFTLESFLKSIQQYTGTFALVAPPIMTQLAKDPMALRYDVSSLTTLYSGAASLDKSLTEIVASRMGLDCIRQGYGMTETSPATHTTPLEGWKFGSIGVPLPNTDSKVVDTETGMELGPYMKGELLVRGPQVMKGYLANESSTTEAFDTEGWLKTGDVAYHDDDGHYYIVDRLKDIIKYKGYQISPAYLESVLLSHPAVQDAAVVGVDVLGVGEVPLAWVVPSGPCSADEIENFVADKVAPYKRLRGGVHFVPEIFKSGSGKILRRNIRKSSMEKELFRATST